jgi:hypothetical protein
LQHDLVSTGQERHTVEYRGRRDTLDLGSKSRELTLHSLSLFVGIRSARCLLGKLGKSLKEP